MLFGIWGGQGGGLVLGFHFKRLSMGAEIRWNTINARTPHSHGLLYLIDRCVWWSKYSTPHQFLRLLWLGLVTVRVKFRGLHRKLRHKRSYWGQSTRWISPRQRLISRIEFCLFLGCNFCNFWKGLFYNYLFSIRNGSLGHIELVLHPFDLFLVKFGEIEEILLSAITYHVKLRNIQTLQLSDSLFSLLSIC